MTSKINEQFHTNVTGCYHTMDRSSSRDLDLQCARPFCAFDNNSRQSCDCRALIQPKAFKMLEEPSGAWMLDGLTGYTGTERLAELVVSCFENERAEKVNRGYSRENVCWLSCLCHHATCNGFTGSRSALVFVVLIVSRHLRGDSLVMLHAAANVPGYWKLLLGWNSWFWFWRLILKININRKIL